MRKKPCPETGHPYFPPVIFFTVVSGLCLAVSPHSGDRPCSNAPHSTDTQWNAMRDGNQIKIRPGASWRESRCRQGVHLGASAFRGLRCILFKLVTNDYGFGGEAQETATQEPVSPFEPANLKQYSPWAGWNGACFAASRLPARIGPPPVDEPL